ncbi:hypothetical protein [Mucilaginibacter sp.]|uniref:hypothetical protein n=1 Tax=Mucilaginibacter sp. TaxID=1882438 RepID=UPI0025EF3C89|nr:hypothetical protein [Mucilaginibacter sp.]
MSILTSKNKTDGSKSTESSRPASKELKTDFPMSEKDELKKAEEQMRKRAKGK